jgi:hypothetical protein
VSARYINQIVPLLKHQTDSVSIAGLNPNTARSTILRSNCSQGLCCGRLARGHVWDCRFRPLPIPRRINVHGGKQSNRTCRPCPDTPVRRPVKTDQLPPCCGNPPARSVTAGGVGVRRATQQRRGLSMQPATSMRTRPKAAKHQSRLTT